MGASSDKEPIGRLEGEAPPLIMPLTGSLIGATYGTAANISVTIVRIEGADSRVKRRAEPLLQGCCYCCCTRKG